MTKFVVKSCLFALALAPLTLPRPATAENEACLVVQDMLFADVAQDLFYRKADGRWERVPAEGLALTGSQTRLIYVVREFTLERPRGGVIAVKTGRRIEAGEADPEAGRKRIHLNRPYQRALAGCGKPEAFTAPVSALEYDRFHDYGYAATAGEDGTALRDFHTRYVGRSNTCDGATDSTTFDAPLRWDWRNNRSQFSFDPEVVRGGFHSQILAGLSISRAAANGSVGLADQRVSIITYRTNGQNIACIPLTVNLTGKRFFVRFNDLEGAQNGPRLIRADELARQLTR
jgi:hypothetical protein